MERSRRRPGAQQCSADTQGLVEFAVLLSACMSWACPQGEVPVWGHLSQEVPLAVHQILLSEPSAAVPGHPEMAFASAHGTLCPLF